MTLWILCGPPGAGKSTYMRKRGLGRNEVYVSRDEIRFSMLKNDDKYFKHEKDVFNAYTCFIQEALDNNKDVFADATHLNYYSRNKLLKSLNLKNTTINCIVFNTPLVTCLTRNNTRSGRERVPEDVVIKMYNSFTNPKEDNYKYNMILEIEQEEDNV